MSASGSRTRVNATARTSTPYAASFSSIAARRIAASFAPRSSAESASIPRIIVRTAVLGGRVDELVDVAGRDRVDELDGIADPEREHEVDVDVDAVGRADGGDRHVERELAGGHDVGQGEERVDPVDARLADALVASGPGDEADRARRDAHEQARREPDDERRRPRPR